MWVMVTKKKNMLKVFLESVVVLLMEYMSVSITCHTKAHCESAALTCTITLWPIKQKTLE